MPKIETRLLYSNPAGALTLFDICWIVSFISRIFLRISSSEATFSIFRTGSWLYVGFTKAISCTDSRTSSLSSRTRSSTGTENKLEICMIFPNSGMACPDSHLLTDCLEIPSRSASCSWEYLFIFLRDSSLSQNLIYSSSWFHRFWSDYISFFSFFKNLRICRLSTPGCMLEKPGKYHME